MPEHRLNPEKLLQLVQEEANKAKRGKLKIYLGAAPGVGKTYNMLQDAILERAKGLDIVIGVVESHGRTEIEAMLKKFETLPKQNIDYRGITLREFDLDAALKRSPALILIDEMAHTNAPNLRHAKRWQDIKEILDRGIDVYTTLNVQHIESLNDSVTKIIYAPIKETVPDSMIETADTIELVDIPPEELIKRVEEGKVYFPEQAELATEHYFREGNLIALRELALRVTAEWVGVKVLLYRQDKGIKEIWPTQDKILVCVGPNPESLKLIRAAKRLATGLQAKWLAVYIDTPQLQSSEKQRGNAIQNLRLAEQLGAETHVLAGVDIVKEVMIFARDQNVTQIMIWKYIHTRWYSWFNSSLADELVSNSREIDVYIMTGESSETTSRNTQSSIFSSPWKIYGIAVGVVGLTTLINYLLFSYLKGSSNLIMIYLLGITAVALFGSIGPSLLASILSVLAYDFFFISPPYSLDVFNLQTTLNSVLMLLVAQVISYLTIRIRRQADSTRSIQHQTSALYSLSRQLASIRGIDKLLERGTRYIAEKVDSDVFAFLPTNSHLEIRGNYKSIPSLDSKEQGIAQWVYQLGQNAGFGTDTLSFSNALYIPLFASLGPIGVLRIQPKKHQLFSPEQLQFIEICAKQIAMALEVDRSHERKKQEESEARDEGIRRNFLLSIFHALSPPLIAIMSAARTLIESKEKIDEKKIKRLGKNIYSETEELSRLINSLLQITYLESQDVKLEKKLSSLKKAINHVVKKSSKKLKDRVLQINIPEDLPFVAFDNSMIEEVLLNLIDNAVKFTPIASPIIIYAMHKGEAVIVSIEDTGSDMMPDEINKLFEKIYHRRKLITGRGLDLGLTICRSIIEAHEGRIWAENRKEGGVVFRFTLPLRHSED